MEFPLGELLFGIGGLLAGIGALIAFLRLAQLAERFLAKKNDNSKEGGEYLKHKTKTSSSSQANFIYKSLGFLIYHTIR